MSSIRNIIIIIVTIFSFSSCRHKAVIPKNTMSKIYYDIYLADQMVMKNRNYRKINDTTSLYEAIFNKYGFTREDYQKSLDFYMVRPDRFAKVFIKSKEMLELKKIELERRLASEKKISERWEFLDSLELFTADTIQRNEYYRTLRILFFKPDSLVPDSPVMDSAFMARPQNPFMVFPYDTVYYSFKTYNSKPIPSVITVPVIKDTTTAEKKTFTEPKRDKLKQRGRNNGAKRIEMLDSEFPDKRSKKITLQKKRHT